MLIPKRISGYLLAALFFISLTSSVPASASNNDLQEIPVAERQEILEKMKSLQKTVHAISASVVQEKQLSALKKKVTIEGTVTMAKPNMLRWDIAKPEKSLTVIDGETMTVYHPDVKEAQVYTLAENLIACNTMNFFAAAMGSLEEMEKKFSVNVFHNGSEIILKLSPLSSIVRKYLSTIVIHYNELTGLPQEFETMTPKGDRIVTKLKNIKTNPELKLDTFKIKLPENVWITNKFEENTNN